MLESLDPKYKLIFTIVPTTLLALTFLWSAHSQVGSPYPSDYIFITVSFVAVLFAYLITIIKNPFNFFDSIHLYTAFYLLIFFVTPLVLINLGQTTCFGVYIMGSAKKTTFIVAIGLVSYYIGYSTSKPSINLQLRPQTPKTTDRRRILIISYFYFLAVSLLNIYVLLSAGKSVSYILTLGGGTYEKQEGLTSGMRFIINFCYTTIVPWLVICFYSRLKIIKIVISYLIFAIFFAYGWRFITYIMAISFFIVYFRFYNKTPKVTHIASLFVGLLLFSVVLGSVRSNIRRGEKANFDGFSIQNIGFTLESNFNIYQSFYAIVDNYPQNYNHTYGQATLVYPVIMWIPRFIWPEKPLGKDYPISQATINSINSFAIEDAGFATPNIGEYYLDFGIPGVIIFFFVIGYASKYMLWFYYSDSFFDLIIYAVFCGFLIQFINRGYIAQSLTLSVFLFGPLLLYRKYYKAEIKLITLVKKYIN